MDKHGLRLDMRIKVQIMPERTSKRMGKPRRSKGCNICILRKVKCDEGVPSCGQCLKGGRKCSGVASAIFMNTDSTTLSTTSTFAPRNAAKGPKEEPEETEESPTSSTSISPSRRPKTQMTVWEAQRRTAKHSQNVNTREQVVDRNASPSQVTETLFKMTAQMKSSSVASHQFLSHFISFFTRNAPTSAVGNSWMGFLPGWLASTNSAAVGQATLAASMAFVARQSQDHRILVESFKWYGSGLSSHRKTIEGIFRAKREPLLDEICTPILLAFFEIACCTSQNAYFQHIMGAAHMLAVFGPKRCRDGVLFELFHTMRLQLIYPMLVMRLPSVFGTEEWIAVPYTSRDKGPLEEIIDVITLSSKLLYRTDKLPEIGDDYERNAELEKIRQEAQSLKIQLDELWEGLREPAAAYCWQGDFFNGIPGVDNPSHLSDWPSGAKPCDYDPLTMPGIQHAEPDNIAVHHRLPDSTEGDELRARPVMALRQDTSTSQNSYSTFGSEEDGALSATTRITEPSYPAVISQHLFTTHEDLQDEVPVRDDLSTASCTSVPFITCDSSNLQFQPTQPLNLRPLTKPASTRPLVFYSTARIIVLSLLSQLGSPPPLCEEQMEAHSESVLRVANYMTSMKIGYAYLRLIMPLHTVGLLSPKAAQRAEARNVLKRWKEVEGIGGICGVALRALEGLGVDDVMDES